MTERKTRTKVILDTNVWIGFLIGKRLSSLKQLILKGHIQIIISNQLLTEIETVTQRPKLSKYFKQEKVWELIVLLKIIGKTYQVEPKIDLCKDPKDNFLLDLIVKSKADFLVTGDKDLLELNPFKSANILTPIEFEKLMK